MKKKKRRTLKRSPEFKESVIMDMRDNRLTFYETSKKYNVSVQTIKRWERIFLTEGKEGLMKERRGRSPK